LKIPVVLFGRVGEQFFTRHKFNRNILAEIVLHIQNRHQRLCAVGIDCIEGGEPLVTVLNVQNDFREDIAVKFMPREELLSNAPEQYDGYFQVPRTIE
jgi:hypothetical protein